MNIDISAALTLANNHQINVILRPSAPGHRRHATRHARHEPATQIRMTNDKIQRTKPAPAPRRTFRHSDFGFLSSFVIRYLSFGRSGSLSQCIRKKRNGALHEPEELA